MAIKVFDCKGYGQIEPSQVWFTRSGMSESQCFLNPIEFASSYPVTPAEREIGKVVAENGVFYMIDKANKTIHIPNENLSKLGYKMGINYSTEKMYSQHTPGRRNFCLTCKDPLPRLGFVEPGMKVCTNAIAWDDTVTETTTVKDDKASDSVNMYNSIKKTLVGHGEPIYVAVIPESKGRLCVVSKETLLSKALGNVYGIITEACTNADRTLSFKIMFIDKPSV